MDRNSLIHLFVQEYLECKQIASQMFETSVEWTMLMFPGVASV